MSDQEKCGDCKFYTPSKENESSGLCTKEMKEPGYKPDGNWPNRRYESIACFEFQAKP